MAGQKPYFPLCIDNEASVMAKIFNDTTATYKFFWFLGILELCVKKGKTRFDAWDIMVEMIASAWYPVCYFKLSFGKADSLHKKIFEIQKDKEIPISISLSELRQRFSEGDEREFARNHFGFLFNFVPYRFLNPWLHTRDNKETVRLSQLFENNCLYKIVQGDKKFDMAIEINERWIDYLNTNYAILRDFTYWSLTLFLQVRNPNVPNIPNKLIKPEIRNSLSRQHKYWDFVILHDANLHCIYTGSQLAVGNYDLDHFMPWSFVNHDLIWNLLPADGRVNSSKSNKLPVLDRYLEKFAIMQQRAIKIAIQYEYGGKLLEDYFSIGCNPADLASMDKEQLVKCFRRTYEPIVQIAQNMGFENWG